MPQLNALQTEVLDLLAMSAETTALLADMVAWEQLPGHMRDELEAVLDDLKSQGLVRRIALVPIDPRIGDQAFRELAASEW